MTRCSWSFVLVWLIALCGLFGVVTATAEAATIVASSKEELHRVALSHRAWNQRTDVYAKEYVYPSKWPLTLDGCGTQVDGKPISPTQLARRPDLFWKLEPLDGQPVEPLSVRSRDASGDWTCAPKTILPALGRWRVTVSAFVSGEPPRRGVARDDVQGHCGRRRG